MQLVINKGGAMKIPSLRNIERTLKMVPLVKDFLPTSNESEPNPGIRNLENALHDKKAEICALREEIIDLKENLANCKYEINILQNALTKGG
jgi:hypothetical protein